MKLYVSRPRGSETAHETAGVHVKAGSRSGVSVVPFLYIFSRFVSHSGFFLYLFFINKLIYLSSVALTMINEAV